MTEGARLALATTRELLGEVAVRMETTQTSQKGRDLAGLCREAIANLDSSVLDYRGAEA
jgi:hypothetical protein